MSIADQSPTSTAVLEVDGLTVEFNYGHGWVPVVEDASFAVGPSETVGLVGESGSGKTVTALAVVGLTKLQRGRISSGRIWLEGREITGIGDREFRRLRGNRVGMIFQQPTRSLNPAFTVGEQVAETVRRHRDVSRAEAWARAVDLLERVQIPKARQRAKDYPHMFSGGMSQRVMIAIALACDPALLIADEPTTALDVTVQASVLELLRTLQRDTGIAILFISHDFAVIAEMCDRVAVMYAGQVIESAPIVELFRRPRHPYTAALLESIPQLGRSRRLISIPGTVPRPDAQPIGCRFFARCPYGVHGRCDMADPGLGHGTPGHPVRCVRHDELSLPGAL